MLEPYAPLLALILTIVTIPFVVAFGVWSLIHLIRHGVTKGEKRSTTPKWVNILLCIAAVLIIVGAISKMEQWSGGTIIEIIGQIAALIILGYNIFQKDREKS